jgi:hypothetical protein
MSTTMKSSVNRQTVDPSAFPERVVNSDVLAAMSKERFDAIVVHGDTMFRGDSARAIARLAARQRLPAVGGEDLAEAGVS